MVCLPRPSFLSHNSMFYSKDGMMIIWSPSAHPQASTYGSDLSPEDLQHEKEYWKPRTTFRYV